MPLDSSLRLDPLKAANDVHAKVSARGDGPTPRGVIGIEVGGPQLFDIAVKLGLSEKTIELLVEPVARSSLDLVVCHPHRLLIRGTSPH